MHYRKIIEARFVNRVNRFVAEVEVQGEILAVHVKNTGRCRELLLPGARVVLSESDHAGRKYAYDLVTVWKEGLGWVNIDSQAPNQVVMEWLSGENEYFKNISLIKPEYKYGDSRIDFYIEQGDSRILMEVKGCTLEIDGEGYFPDAPTLRGVKHLKELAAAVKTGYEACLAYVIAMPGVSVVHPNVATHPAYGAAVEEAMKAGVKILYLCCQVSPGSLKIISCLEGGQYAHR